MVVAEDFGCLARLPYVIIVLVQLPLKYASNLQAGKVGNIASVHKVLCATPHS